MARAVVRPDEIRRHNLGLVLELVHREGELSRAELTARLGLSRSTTRALVADLAELGILSEAPPPRTEGVGRPSKLVGPRRDGPVVLAVDLDVDHVVCAVVGLAGEVLDRTQSGLRRQSRSPHEVAQVIAQQVSLLGSRVPPGAWPIAVAVSLPGTVSRTGQDIGFLPNLEWRDVPFAGLLRVELSQRLDPAIPVLLGNDANLGALAEHLRGSARGCDDVLYLVGRVGVGAGVLTNGGALRGHHGLAGEIGHVMLDPGGPRCHCGNRGCVESYLGLPALRRRFDRSEGTSPDDGSWLPQAMRTAASTAGVSVADALGRTLAILVNLLNPQRIVLAGTLSHVLSVAVGEVTATMDEHSFRPMREQTELRAAGLADDSSLLGAAELAFEALLADPTSTPRPDPAVTPDTVSV